MKMNEALFKYYSRRGGQAFQLQIINKKTETA